MVTNVTPSSFCQCIKKEVVAAILLLKVVPQNISEILSFSQEKK
jgi:hypothetical protein